MNVAISWYEVKNKIKIKCNLDGTLHPSLSPNTQADRSLVKFLFQIASVLFSCTLTTPLYDRLVFVCVCKLVLSPPVCPFTELVYCSMSWKTQQLQAATAEYSISHCLISFMTFTGKIIQLNYIKMSSFFRLSYTLFCSRMQWEARSLNDIRVF